MFVGMRECRQFRADETGSELVEFALSSTLLLMAIFGVIGCSLALYANHFIAYAAREGARYAMVRGSSWSGTACSTPSAFDCMAESADLTTFVDSITPAGLSTSNLKVTPTWTGLTASGLTCNSLVPPTNNYPGCMVQVQVTYSYNFNLPFLPISILKLNSTSAVTIAQ
jgi:Flp pilus assembly protein TadG